MIPLHYLRLFSASGTDAGDFLHGQLTADIVSLLPGSTTLAAWCSPRGQVIAPMLVQRREEHWLIALEQSLANETIQRMARFILRARVKFTEFENRWLTGSLDVVPRSGHQESLWLDRLNLGYELTDEPGSRSAAESAAAERKWKAWELRRGLSWLSTSTTERFLPQMLGLDDLGAVSFNKGCYPGQEIVARARHLGKVKRRPVILELEGSAEIQTGRECVLSGPGIRVEGTVLDSVCADGDVTTAIVITSFAERPEASAAGTEEDPPVERMNPVSVDSLSVGESSWPARRVERVTR